MTAEDHFMNAIASLYQAKIIIDNDENYDNITNFEEALAKITVKNQVATFLDELYNAMRHLYNARYMVTGDEKDHFKDMDIDAFDKIAHLQTLLQNLITQTENKEKSLKQQNEEYAKE